MDHIGIITTTEFHLKGYMGDMIFVGQNLFYSVPDLIGIANLQITGKINMSFKMQFIFTQVPGMNMVNIQNFRKEFKFFLNELKVNVPGSGLHQNIDRFFK